MRDIISWFQKNKKRCLMVLLGLVLFLILVLAISSFLYDRQSKSSEQVDSSDGSVASAEGEEGLTPILGESRVTAEDLAEYFQSSGADYPSEALSKGGAATLEDFCQMYCEEAEKEGVRPEVAFAQAMKETAWLKFGGAVTIDQYNFAGIGATDDGASGESYPDVRTGIRAQIQHLKAYASTGDLASDCVDTRFDYVKRGSAPYVEWLGQQENPDQVGWATDEGYGDSIVTMMDQITNPED